MRTQPNLGLRRFISTMAAMSSAEGPLEPGVRRGEEEDVKSRRYFRQTKALWSLSSVAGLMNAPSFRIRRGLTNTADGRFSSYYEFATRSQPLCHWTDGAKIVHSLQRTGVVRR